MGKIKTDELEERVGSAGITVNSTVKNLTVDFTAKCVYGKHFHGR